MVPSHPKHHTRHILLFSYDSILYPTRIVNKQILRQLKFQFVALTFSVSKFCVFHKNVKPVININFKVTGKNRCNKKYFQVVFECHEFHCHIYLQSAFLGFK